MLEIVVIGVSLGDSPPLVANVQKLRVTHCNHKAFKFYSFSLVLILIFLFLQAWLIAVLYHVELHTFYSPDIDVINGLKMAAQVALRTITVLTAALATYGEAGRAAMYSGEPRSSFPRCSRADLRKLSYGNLDFHTNRISRRLLTSWLLLEKGRQYLFEET